MLRLPVLGLALALAVGLPSFRRDAAAAQATDAQAKAAWILNFARYVHWPSNTFAATNTPIRVGVLGKDPILQELSVTLKGQRIDGHGFVVKAVVSDPEVLACQILFISSSERRRLRELSEKLKAFGVLTVGDTDEFLDQGGVINFVLREKALRFDINVTTAQAARIKLDAKLLHVARTVRGRYD